MTFLLNFFSLTAIVLAFLRQVEDYSGIAFLTSNIEHGIDEATRSRLTGLVKYEYPLGDRLRRAWVRSLRRFDLGDAETESLATNLSTRYRPDFRMLEKTLELVEFISKIREEPISEKLVVEVFNFRGEAAVQSGKYGEGEAD
ncbi:hypothetical protein M434DRAFT_30490 [Hypoxylon sp. CO27-5]|nr:hypothetical protein M434DRAFT_30490 [Hypoxylon sp. CO27-5]